MRFSTLDLLSATGFAAVVVWCTFPESPRQLVQIVLALAFVAACAAFRFRNAKPYQSAACAGLLFWAAALVCWWTRHWIGYFCYDPSAGLPPYFEDGMLAEGVIYPFVFFVFYSPVVVLISLCAAIISIVPTRFLRKV